VTLGDEEDTRHAIAAARAHSNVSGTRPRRNGRKSFSVSMRPLRRVSTI
jgi:hypothetical protein